MAEVELSRRERKKEETKERIFKAAIRLFKHKGFEETTVDEIAETADVAKGTFFNYFPRKEAVLGYLPELWLAEGEERTAEILASREPAGERIRDMFTEFASFYEDDRELSKYVVREWMDRQSSGTDEACCRWDAFGIDVVRQLQANCEVRRDVDPERAYQVLGGVYHGTLMQWLTTEPIPFPLRDELRRRLTLVMEGLMGRSKEGK